MDKFNVASQRIADPMGASKSPFGRQPVGNRMAGGKQEFQSRNLYPASS